MALSEVAAAGNVICVTTAVLRVTAKLQALLEQTLSSDCWGQVALTVEHGWLGGDGYVLCGSTPGSLEVLMMMVKEPGAAFGMLGSVGDGC